MVRVDMAGFPARVTDCLEVRGHDSKVRPVRMFVFLFCRVQLHHCKHGVGRELDLTWA